MDFVAASTLSHFLVISNNFMELKGKLHLSQPHTNLPYHLLWKGVEGPPFSKSHIQKTKYRILNHMVCLSKPMDLRSKVFLFEYRVIHFEPVWRHSYRLALQHLPLLEICLHSEFSMICTFKSRWSICMSCRAFNPLDIWIKTFHISYYSKVFLCFLLDTIRWYKSPPSANSMTRLC